MSFLPVDVLIDQKAKQRHRIDTLNLLGYVSLLILLLVSTWFIKRRHASANRWHVHETGLAIIFGLAMGAALRYFGLEVTISSIRLDDKLPRRAPADYVTILAHDLGNTSHVYAYEFRGQIEPNARLGSQISYASVDPELFFNIILPPIVLNAGLSLKRRHFFRNIGAIFSYAFLGTSLSVATVGALLYGFVRALKHYLAYNYLAEHFSLANCLYFGAIISPTDPLAVLAIFQELGVDVNLFALVFGESILNDAVSIVLTHSIDTFSIIYNRDPHYSIWRLALECLLGFLRMFAVSCSIGALFGIITAITTKFTKLTESPLLESSLVLLMSYAAFLVAEVVDASGIVAILMCGITQAHYTINNLSFEARERLKSLFELLTFLCENFLFLAVGVCFWQRGQTWNLPFIGAALLAITVARGLSVYPLTVAVNLGRKQKIPMNYQHLIAWGGAARGVISYSLAARNTVGDARRIMLSTTTVIVIITVIAVGSAIGPLLKWLSIPFGAAAAAAAAKQGRNAVLCAAANREHAPANGVAAAPAHRQQAPPGQPELAEGEEQNEIGGHEYHATNNPAWIVRPKRLAHSVRWMPMRHHSYHHQHEHAPNDSTLIIGLECSPDCCSGARAHRRLNRRHHSCQGAQLKYNQFAPLEATPVLEIEPVSASFMPAARLGCRCCPAHEAAQLDSRTASSSLVLGASAQQDQLIIAPAGSQPAHHSAALPPPTSQPSSRANDETRRLAANLMSDHATTAASSSALANVSADCAAQASLVSHTTTDTQTPNSSSLVLARTRPYDPNISPYENASLVRRWRNIDNYFIKPLLTNCQPTLLETMPASLRSIARLFTSDEQLMRRNS